jgi:hypothetical protein
VQLVFAPGAALVRRGPARAATPTVSAVGVQDIRIAGGTIRREDALADCPAPVSHLALDSVDGGTLEGIEFPDGGQRAIQLTGCHSFVVKGLVIRQDAPTGGLWIRGPDEGG